MARLRFNAVAGVLSQGIGPKDNSVTSPGFSRMGAVSDPDVAMICLTGQDTDGNIIRGEVCYVILHDPGSQVAFINRGQDGSIAQDWPAGTTWSHTLGAADFEATA